MTLHPRQLSTICLALAMIGLILPVKVFANAPDFAGFESVEKRQEAFFDFFLPLIKERNQEILALREKLKKWRDDPKSVEAVGRDDVESIAADYGIDDFTVDSSADWQRLMRRVDVIPPSLVLAQAAIESAWGTSSFARQGNNFFGKWCFSEGCGLVPDDRPEGESYEVEVFDSAEASLDAYMRNLNTHRAYASLRSLRGDLRDRDEPVTGEVLAQGLDEYSARGEEYVGLVRTVINNNDLVRYDRR